MQEVSQTGKDSILACGASAYCWALFAPRIIIIITKAKVNPM